MLHVIERAVGYYKNRKDVWNTLQQRGMKGDYSWTHSAGEYIKLYESLFEEKKAASAVSEEQTNPVVVDI